MLETKGPEIRTGVLKDGKDHEIASGTTLEIFTDYAIEGDYSRIACNYKNLPQSVSVGSVVCIGDGVVQAEVIEVAEVSTSLSTKKFLLKLTCNRLTCLLCVVIYQDQGCPWRRHL